jgi:hypothetical protein
MSQAGTTDNIMFSISILTKKLHTAWRECTEVKQIALDVRNRSTGAAAMCLVVVIQACSDLAANCQAVNLNMHFASVFLLQDQSLVDADPVIWYR